jgi:putative Holliday junction resolvase
VWTFVATAHEFPLDISQLFQHASLRDANAMDKPNVLLGKIAGIDYGTVRIGISISDADRIIASPYETYVRKSPERDATYFRQLVSEERITQFVLGLPLHLSGDLSEKAKEVLQFGRWLKEITSIEVDYMDERYTSVEAERILREAKLTEKKRKERRDKLAAQIMLTAYLESGCKGITEHLGIEDNI